MRRLLALLAAGLVSSSALAGEVVRLDDQSWDKAPKGRQIDACTGDYVMTNGIVSVTVADSRPDRLGNTSFPNCSGLILDFTRIADNNDFMVAFSPGDVKYDSPFVETKIGQASGSEVSVISTRKATQKDPVEITTEYKLVDGEAYVQITTTIKNTGTAAVERKCFDRLRVDQNASQTVVPEGDAVWTYNNYSDAAYAVYYKDGGIKMTPMPVFYERGAMISYSGLAQLKAAASQPADAPKPGKKSAPAGPSGTEFMLQPGQELKWSCMLLNGKDQFDLLGQLLALRGKKTAVADVAAAEGTTPIADVDLSVKKDGKVLAQGQSDAKGLARLVLEPGTYQLSAGNVSRPTETVDVTMGEPQKVQIAMKPACGVDVEVTDQDGKGIPAKVQFLADDPKNDPNYGPGCLTFAMQNLALTPNGKIHQNVPAGPYTIVISHGPEYDSVTQKAEIKAGEFLPIKAQLKHVVDTTGYISGDFHGHTLHSGDNAAQGTGRVLSLAVEGVEFAPSTDHTRIVDWQPFVDELGLQPWLTVCTGEEISGPGAGMHMNSWPLTLKAHQQSNGGIHSGGTLDEQAKRVADSEATERTITFNHPKFDLLYTASIAPKILNSSEAHSNPLDTKGGMARGWIDAINSGIRWTGLLNTDSHTTFHGSGYRRNWVVSATDDVTKINAADVVSEVKKGHVICSTGPFMTVTAGKALPGDDVQAENGKVTLHVKVQCPNWLDVNHVAVLGNGQPIPELDFTREKNADMFKDGVVKFEQDIPVTLASDTHLIVVTEGKGLKTNPVMGGRASKGEPYAFSNPIYVDVDGGGFKFLGTKPAPKKGAKPAAAADANAEL